MDGDIFTRSVPPVWRRVAEAVGDRSSPEVCAYLIESALAKELRRGGGLGVLGLSGEPVGASHPSRERVASDLQQRWQIQVVERVAPILVGRGKFQSYGDVRRFVDQIDERARFDSLAGSLLKRPNGARLRRPPRRRYRTGDLVSESAPLGERA